MQSGDSAGTVIRDSSIGANGFNGIWLNGAVPNVTVTANTLAGNNNNGVVVSGPATGVVVSNNTITGSGLTGIRTEVVARAAPSGMTISGNTLKTNQENGMILAGNTSSTVSGNTVSQNSLQGIVLTLGAAGNQIQSNTIDRNGGIGVVLSGATTIGNAILSNSIFRNVRGGIALLQGANRSQVAPRLTSARVNSSRIVIAGTIAGRAGDVFRIQYFSNQSGDATSAATVQGRSLIGFRDVTLTSNTANVNVTLAVTGIPVNSWISATATRLVSSLPSDTSQFSAGVRATAG